MPAAGWQSCSAHMHLLAKVPEPCVSLGSPQACRWGSLLTRPCKQQINLCRIGLQLALNQAVGELEWLDSQGINNQREICQGLGARQGVMGAKAESGNSRTARPAMTVLDSISCACFIGSACPLAAAMAAARPLVAELHWYLDTPKSLMPLTS